MTTNQPIDKDKRLEPVADSFNFHAAYAQATELGYDGYGRACFVQGVKLEHWKMQKQITDQAAKIAELEAEVEQLNQDIVDVATIEALRYNTRIHDLTAQCEGLVKALEFYADKKNWGEPSSDMRNWYVIESTDRGEKARAALDAWKAGKNG